MNVKIMAVAVVAIMVAAGAGVYLVSAKKSHEVDNREFKTGVDAMGNEIRYRYPVERVCPTSLNALDFVAAIYGEGYEKKLCAFPEDIKLREPTKYEAYLKSTPSLEKLPLSPDIFSSPQFPAQKLMSFKPDVVLVEQAMLDWMKFTPESYKILVDAGIAVFSFDTFYNPTGDGEFRKVVEPLAELFEKKDRGKRLIERFEGEMAKIKAAMANVPEELKNKSIYLELTSANYQTEYAPTMTAAPEADYCEAINIAKEIFGGMPSDKPISKEQLIEKNPDYIILTITTYYGSENAKMFGFGKTPDHGKLQEWMQGYKNRTGWNTLKAVENNNVFFWYSELRGNISTFMNLIFMGKMLYPDQFSEFDAEKTLVDLYSDFMPISGKGLFLYKSV